MNERRQKLTKSERMQILSGFLRRGIKNSWSPRSFAVFERHLNQAEDKSLPMEKRVKAANKIDQMFYRKMKKHEQTN